VSNTEKAALGAGGDNGLAPVGELIDEMRWVGEGEAGLVDWCVGKNP
jgi:hypothetical protein